MRTLVLAALLLTGCRGGTAPESASAALRFLPSSPELAVRIDLVRARAWPLFGKAAPIATRGAQHLLEAAQRQCDLDLVGETATVILARRGPLLGGDLTLVATGLPRAKLIQCLTTVANAGSVVQPVIDGDLVHINVSGRAIASGAFLPTGEVVLVARNGAGVEPAAWKAEVRQGARTVPAWWTELDAGAPIAVRSVTPERTVLASVELGDPLVVRGKLINPTPDAATGDRVRLQAIFNYLTQGEAGTGKLDGAGATTTLGFTATGPQIESLVTIALPALFEGGPAVPARDLAADATRAPRDCASLGPAVASYLSESMSKAPPERRKEMEEPMKRLVSELPLAYIGPCHADQWAFSSIDCHVDHATDLPRFERCRQMLTAAQREHLDAAVSAALTAASKPATGAPAAR